MPIVLLYHALWLARHDDQPFCISHAGHVSWPCHTWRKSHTPAPPDVPRDTPRQDGNSACCEWRKSTVRLKS